MKIKTLKDNVLGQNKAGTILEVHEQVGKHLIAKGCAEEEKAKKSTKKSTKEGE